MSKRAMAAVLTTVVLSGVGALGGLGASAPVSAATRTSGCSTRNLGQLRFDLIKGTVQVCARVGRSYVFRAATSAESRVPYAAYFTPMVGATYVDIAQDTAALLVKSLGPVFRDQSGKSFFSGFATAGLHSNASLAVADTVMVVLPLTALARALFDQNEVRAQIEFGADVVTIAGRPLVISDGAYIFVGQASFVVFAAMGDTVPTEATISAWLTAHPGA